MDIPHNFEKVARRRLAARIGCPAACPLDNTVFEANRVASTPLPCSAGLRRRPGFPKRTTPPPPDATPPNHFRPFRVRIVGSGRTCGSGPVCAVGLVCRFSCENCAKLAKINAFVIDPRRIHGLSLIHIFKGFGGQSCPRTRFPARPAGWKAACSQDRLHLERPIFPHSPASGLTASQLVPAPYRSSAIRVEQFLEY